MDSNDPTHDWPLRLSYAFELFDTDPLQADGIVDEIADEISASKDEHTRRYRAPFSHIVRGTKAHMMIKTCPESLETLQNLIGSIKPKGDMTNEELSGLVAMKASVLRVYGPDGTHKSVPLLREAARLNPKEVEWPLSLVISKNRIRHYMRGPDTEWSAVEEVVNILEDLLNHPDISPQQTVTCKYNLAVTYNDYVLGKYPSPEIKSCYRQIFKLCEEIYRQTDHPQTLAFCAQQFANNLFGDKAKSLEIIEEGLKKFPEHIGLNTTACKIFKNMKQYSTAANYAQKAFEYGGYGAAWLLLECKVKLKDTFDEDEFFNDLIASYPIHKKQTLVAASMFSFFEKKNVKKGARYMEQAIEEDPTFEGFLRYNYVQWIGKKMLPIEVAYNQIVRSLEEADDAILLRAKSKIEEVTDVKGFDVRNDFVQLRGLPPSRYRPRNN